MNEQANIALIQTLYDAFAKGDIAGILSKLSADIEWNAEGPTLLQFTGKRKGPAQVGHFFAIHGGKIVRYVNVIDTAALAEAYS